MTGSAEEARPHMLAVGADVEPELRLEAVQRLPPDLQTQIDELARAARAADGVNPFGEHKWLRLIRGDDRCAALLLRSEDKVVAAAHCDAYHVGPWSGACRLTAEVVVHPSFRGRGLGRQLLARAVDLARDEWADHLHLWAYGNLPTARKLAERFGFSSERVLLQYVLPYERLPVSVELPPNARLRAFEPSRDAAIWLELHNRVFAEHPEQGRWEPADLEARLEQPWFDPRDLLLVDDTQSGQLIGFCWTKIPLDDNLPGEIYIVGIHPDARGRGLGRRLTELGLAHIRHRGRRGATLYVESDNLAAIRMYESLGFVPHAEHVCYARRLTHPPS